MGGGYSKSIFTNKNIICGGSSRSIINPVSNPINISYYLSGTQLLSLQTIEKYYTLNLANQSYTDIPTDYMKYVALYTQLTKLKLKTSNSTILLLLKIAQEGLHGSMNSIILNTNVVELNITNLILRNQIAEFESHQNVVSIPLPSVEGMYSITKNISLANIYKYYITLFGMPDPLIGFNPNILSILSVVLEKHGIDPWN